MTREEATSEHVDEPAEADTPIPPATGRIVVGVDGSAGSMTALDWAVREARLRAGSVQVVMAWQQPQTYGAPGAFAMGVDPSMEPQKALANAATTHVARLRHGAQEGQDVKTTWETIEGRPGAALLRAAEGADMLVVGSRGLSRLVGTLLGSVSQHVVMHARCPVVVIPGPRRDTTPTHDASVRPGRLAHWAGER